MILRDQNQLRYLWETRGPKKDPKHATIKPRDVLL